MISTFHRVLAIFIVTVLSTAATGAAIAGGSTNEPTKHIVEITGFKFVPESLTVSAGDTITWINRDIAPHTATNEDATNEDLSFDTGQILQNESKTITVTSNQTVSYFCRYHPMMKGKLILE